MSQAYIPDSIEAELRMAIAVASRKGDVDEARELAGMLDTYRRHFQVRPVPAQEEPKP